MFEKFGKFDSVEDLNQKAKELLENEQELLEMAEENGISKEDAEDYIDGCVNELASELIMAHGRIEVESKDLELKGVLCDWKDVVTQMCIDEKAMRTAVLKKELKGCIAKIIEFSFDKKEPVSKKILAKTWVNHNGKREKFKGDLYLGFPNTAETKKLVREYYEVP